MNHTEKIKTAFDRVVKAFSRNPQIAKGTGVSVSRITAGLTCEIQEGKWTFTADMPETAGGNDKGPTPGVYGRAALGSCLAIGYMMRAAKYDIAVKSLQVEVQADYDDGVLFGTSDGYPGYHEIRITVKIDSDAGKEKIMQLLKEADAHSPYLDVFSRAQTCKVDYEIISSKIPA